MLGHSAITNTRQFTGNSPYSISPYSTGKANNRLHGPWDPFNLAFLGRDLYVANNADGTVSVLDTIGNTVVRTIEVGGHPYAVAGAVGRVFVTDYGFCGGQSTHRVSVIGAARRAHSSPLPGWAVPLPGPSER